MVTVIFESKFGMKIIEEKSFNLIAGYATVFISTILTWILWVRVGSPFMGHPPYTLFLIGCIIASYFGGFGPGFLATMIGAISVFLKKFYEEVDIFSADQYIRFILFCIAGFTIGLVCEKLKRRTQSLNAALTELASTRSESQDILESITDGIISFNEKGIIQKINSPAASMINIPSKNALGKNLLDVIPEFTSSLEFSKISENFRNGQNAITEFFLPNEQRWYEVKAFSSKTSNNLFFNEITGRKNHEKIISNLISEKENAYFLLDSLLSDASIGFAFLDCDGLIVRHNSALTHLMNYSNKGLLNSELDKIGLNCEKNIGSVIQKVINTQKPEVGVELFINDAGRRRYFECSFYPVNNFIKEAFIVGVVFVEITKQKEILREIKRALSGERAARSDLERANQLKDEFMATLSHELRTPLTSVLGWAELISKRPNDIEVAKEGIRAIERGIHQQVQLIDELLDMSRINEGKLCLEKKYIELPDILEEAIQSIEQSAQQKQITIKRDLSYEAQSFFGDRSRLMQIFLNLLTNAIKFTPSNGEIYISLAQRANSIEIKVKDTGVGIESEFLPHIFDRFRQADGSITRQHGGLGLGLAIVKQLVDLHRGQIYAFSEGRNKGTTFIISFPIVTSPGKNYYQGHRENHELENGPSKKQNFSGLKVLAVDDDKSFLDILKRILASSKAEVFTATSVSEALKRVKEINPDIILSDIGMPEESGFDLICKLKSDYASKDVAIPIIAITAFARSEDIEQIMQAGFQAHLAKPFNSEDLIKLIRDLVPSNKCS